MEKKYEIRYTLTSDVLASTDEVEEFAQEVADDVSAHNLHKGEEFVVSGVLEKSTALN